MPNPYLAAALAEQQEKRKTSARTKREKKPVERQSENVESE